MDKVIMYSIDINVCQMQLTRTVLFALTE